MGSLRFNAPCSLNENPDRILFLAVTKDVMQDIFKGEMGELLQKLQKYKLAQVIGFDPQTEEIIALAAINTYRQTIDEILLEYTKIPIRVRNYSNRSRTRSGE